MASAVGSTRCEMFSYCMAHASSTCCSVTPNRSSASPERARSRALVAKDLAHLLFAQQPLLHQNFTESYRHWASCTPGIQSPDACSFGVPRARWTRARDFPASSADCADTDEQAHRTGYTVRNARARWATCSPWLGVAFGPSGNR